MTIDELTDRIVEWEAQRTATQSAPDRRQIRAELHDVDLPALDQRGVIDFNPDEGIVGGHNVDLDTTDHATDERSEPATATSEPAGGARNPPPFLAVAVGAAILLVLSSAVVFGETTAAVLSAALVALATLAAVAYRATRD